LAKPVLEADSKAKVVMRRKVRGLRSLERDVLSDRPETTEAGGNGVVLDYGAAVRGVLNDDHGGPFYMPISRRAARGQMEPCAYAGR
jgi:hypothetical protein